MKTIIEILIDNSNSMGVCEGWKDQQQYLLPDGSTRMSLARRILVNDILPIIEDSSQVNVRLFHSSNDLEKEVILEMDDLYTTHYDKENIVDVVSKIPDPVNTGGTPITTALEACIDELKKYPDWDRKIILVTDGQETEKRDYKDSALKAMKLLGIPCSIFVIGISQSEEAETMSKELAYETKGGYVNLKTAKLDSENMSTKLSQLKSKVLNDQVQKIIANPVSISTAVPTVTVPQSIAEPKLGAALEGERKVKESPIPDTFHQSDSDEDLNQVEEHDVELHNISNNQNDDDEGRKSDKNELLELIGSNRQILSSLNKQIEIIQKEISNITRKEEIIEDLQVLDIATSDVERKRIGKLAEQKLYEVLKIKYGDRLVWENKDSESGKPYDFRVIDGEETEFYIDCKSTKFTEPVFYLTDKEWTFFLKNTKNYQIYLLVDVENESHKLIKIDNLLDWLLKNKVLPYSNKNRAIKANRVLFTVK